MRKPDDLRAWLTGALPALAANPEQLQIYVDAGRIAARQSRTLSFAYRYTLNLLLCDYAGSADDVVVPLLAWIEKEQPDLLRRDDGEPFRYEAEILDGDRVDLLITIDLTENVLVEPKPDACGYIATPLAEPNFADEFAGVGASWLWQGYAGPEQVAQTTHPEAGPLTPGIPPAVV